MLEPVSLYMHTIRYLRPSQIVARLAARLPHLSPCAQPVPPRAARTGPWLPPPARAACLLGPRRVRLLNREREIVRSEDWASGSERLWLYHLHYFDDLVAEHAADRRAWHEALVEAWVRENPPGSRPGWEPYPISRRIVNWMKWELAGGMLSDMALASLVDQVRYLRGRLEWHLLGNHVLVNAKALFFAGLFFQGKEADAWLEAGRRLFLGQLKEQLLPDGAHIERSPMYHALVCEDVLDLVNAQAAYPRRTWPTRATDVGELREAAGRMLRWLRVVTHPDGELALFNDTARGIALSPRRLDAYGAALGIHAVEASPEALDCAGYIRLERGPWCVIFDAAPVGPDYQPGHAHADTLSFELSFAGERVISNSGTSTYEPGAQRDFERSTRAHNTVEIDGENSSEVWAAFRVARRARPFDLRVERSSETLRVGCAHDGYRRLPGRPVHRRTLAVEAGAVRWIDRVEGRGIHRARGFIPLHPRSRVEPGGQGAEIVTAGGRRLVLAACGIDTLRVESGACALEFGVREPRPVLVWERAGLPPLVAEFVLRAVE